ncbi:hypothetical protein Tco_0677813 [Tanacetum coccineum]|uniref:SPK domain-containing protein n=1 Tax=Tanacetum coccineum TaxID=301880 RepID=A0ABQ4XDB4_9ASTR
MNTTQAQQKALDDALVAPADRLEFRKCNMRLKTDIKPKEATFHGGWMPIDPHSILPCIPDHYRFFEDLPLEQDILSFIRDLGHTGDITYLTDVNVDYLHQPWRAFATVINKCLSGKETRMDKIRLSHAKKTNKMSYPRFTKIIIDYFMSKDMYISRRNKMFWHTDRDDTLFTSMRCISRHEDTRRRLQNQSIFKRKLIQTHLPRRSLFKLLKVPDSSKKAKVAKLGKKKQPIKKTKAKGLAVLFEVALTEAEQIKLATKRSKKDFHVSHASGSGDGVDTQSKVPDEQQQKTSGTDEGTGTIPGVPDVPPYESESDKESWGDSEDEDDNDDVWMIMIDEIPDPNLTNVDQTEYEEEDVDDRVRTPSDYELTDDENLDDEETMDDEEDDEVIKELYDDQEEEDAHVTLTPVLDAQNPDEPVQSFSISSDFTSKLLNLDNPSLADNEIASLMETSAHHATVIPELTSGFTTTTPPPTLFFNPLLQQQTPTFTTTTFTNPTVTLPEIPNFAFVFKFDQKVSAIESEISELKQTNQFAEAVSSIPGIVDTYLDSKMKEAVDVAVQLQTNKLKEGSQAENQEFLNQVDSTMKTIIKDQVKAQVSTIMPKIEKYVIESLGAEVLVRSTNQPHTSYAVAASLTEFELKKILIDKINEIIKTRMKTPPLDQTEGRKEGNLQVYPEEEPSHIVDGLRNATGSGAAGGTMINTPTKHGVTRLTIMKKYDYDYLEEIEVRRDDQKLYTFKEGDFKRLRLQDIEDMLLLLVQQKLTNLTIDKRYDLNVALYQFKRKRLMCTDKLHKFNDCTLNDVRTTLYNIVAGIRMEYLPMRKWSNLDKKRARAMVQDIDK